MYVSGEENPDRDPYTGENETWRKNTILSCLFFSK